MTQVLGYPLDEAVTILEQQGFQVVLKEARCRKGPTGDDKRVIRQQQAGTHSVELTFADFLTRIHT